MRLTRSLYRRMNHVDQQLEGVAVAKEGVESCAGGGEIVDAV